MVTAVFPPTGFTFTISVGGGGGNVSVSLVGAHPTNPPNKPTIIKTKKCQRNKQVKRTITPILLVRISATHLQGTSHLRTRFISPLIMLTS
jgi:hypothetical protein